MCQRSSCPLEKSRREICAFCLKKRKYVHAWMSCVTRVMTRDVGVVSSHLKSKRNYLSGSVLGQFRVHLRVVPRTDSISFWWIDLDALRVPNVYTLDPAV